MTEDPRRPPAPRPCHLFARLADGGVVVLRPLRPGEMEVLDSVFAGLSPQSRRWRYLVPTPRLTSSARRVLAEVDGRDHVAWVAMVEGRPVGICRSVRTSGDAAELAFEVVDAEQRRGIASVLVDAVTTVAHANGVVWLEASVAPGNEAAALLLSRLGMTLTLREGLFEGRARLRLMAPPRVDRRAVLRLAAQAPGPGCEDPHGASSPRRRAG